MELPGYQIQDLLHQGTRARVYRGLNRAGQAVVIRAPVASHPGPRELARYQRAYELGAAADSQAVVRHLDLVRHHDSLALITEAFNGESLAAAIPKRGLDLAVLLRLALVLAEALARLHRGRILHRDLRPATVLVDAPRRSARFIGLDQGTRIKREVDRLRALDPLDSDLRYTAPEQIGRLDAPVDGRADLYSLGATLYHLATGAAPFMAQDAATLAHSLVTVELPALSDPRADIPRPFADIVQRLMRKNAAARYASAVGLAHDLRHCVDAFECSGTIAEFTLGARDVSPLFRLPDRLYGRHHEYRQLEAVLDGVVAGQRSLVQVIGHSGVGKTRLVEELRPQIQARGLRYCAGKFDQFHQDRPYLAFNQAMRELLRALLSEPEETLRAWRHRLQQAVGEHAGALTQELPELNILLGPQPELAEVAPHQAAARFQDLVHRFARAFCAPDSGLVLFVDDLQWADPAAINLLASLAQGSGLERLLIIVGYRSNELGPGHPARRALQAWQAAGVKEVTLAVGALEPEHIRELVADTLHARSDPSGDQPGDQPGRLADQVHTIAGGNVFFVREFLLALNQAEFFRFDEQAGRWTWHLAGLGQQTVPQQLLGLLTARLDQLPPACLDLLDTASCIGSHFDLDSLASVHQRTRLTVARDLSTAVDRGLVVALDDGHRLYSALAAWPGQAPRGNADAADLPNALYRFQHDAVRLTVHEHLDPEQRRARHFQIGRLLLDTLAPEALQQRVVEVFEHLSYDLDSVTDRDQRHLYARLGLDAGRAALRGLAFDAASTLLGNAARLLGDRRWEDDRGLALAIHLGLSECAFARERGKDFETEIALALAHIQTPEETARAYGLLIRVRTVQTRYAEAVDVAVTVARSLGLALPRRPGPQHVLAHALAALSAQRGRPPLSFESLDKTPSAELAAAMHLLSQMSAAANFSEPKLLPLIGTTSTRLSIHHGMCRDSPYGLAVWGLVLCGALGQIERGYQFGELALRIGRRYGGIELGRTHFVVDLFVKHWREPLGDCADMMLRDWDMLRRAGDEEYAVYCAGASLYMRFLSGATVDAGQRHAPAIDYLANCNKPHVRDSFLAWVQLLSDLCGERLPPDLDGSHFDVDARYAEFAATDNAVQIAIGFTAAAILDFFAGRHARAEQRFALVHRNRSGILSQVLIPGLSFFRALNAYRALSGPDRATRARARALRRMARRETRRLRRWSVHAPVNLAHRVSLLEAEEQWLCGHQGDAMLALHTSIERAADHGAPLYQAIAEARLGECLAAGGQAAQALAARERARALFDGCGAPALSNALDDGPLGALGPVPAPPLTTPTGGLEGLDLRTLLQGVHTISSETDPRALIQQLVSAVMRSAGADRCVLILLDPQGQPVVEAEAETNSDGDARRLSQPLAGFHKLAHPAVNLALRTGETILIGNAADSDLLRRDGYSQSSGLRSLLAACIQLKQHTLGLIYLENHVTDDAFGGARVEIATALCAQAGIALDNARLYQNLRGALDTQAALTEANKRFVPTEFLAGLGRPSIVEVKLNEAVERNMNVLFADLRGFTRLSEQLGPSRTVAMINRYLSYVQPAISGHRGFIGQYYGDGILALFPRRADDALYACIAMSRGLEAYNRERGDFPELRFGVGVHCGPLTLGTIGNQDHFQCGVVGDSVNLASRVEALTKFYGATVLISGAVQAKLRPDHRLRYRGMGRIQVPGREQVLTVHECLDAYEKTDREALVAGLADFNAAVAAYATGQWAAAIAGFEACLARCPEDRVSVGFLRRARRRSAERAPWDGIERAPKQ